MALINKVFKRRVSIREALSSVRSLPAFWSALGVVAGIIPVGKCSSAVMDLGSNVLMNLLASVIFI
jgi:hypothetical protein